MRVRFRIVVRHHSGVEYERNHTSTYKTLSLGFGFGALTYDAMNDVIARLHRVYITRAIPKTRAGKIMRRLLREAVQSGQIASDTTGLEDPDSLTAILEAVREGG